MIFFVFIGSAQIKQCHNDWTNDPPYFSNTLIKSNFENVTQSMNSIQSLFFLNFVNVNFSKKSSQTIWLIIFHFWFNFHFIFIVSKLNIQIHKAKQSKQQFGFCFLLSLQNQDIFAMLYNKWSMKSILFVPFFRILWSKNFHCLTFFS